MIDDGREGRRPSYPTRPERRPLRQDTLINRRQRDGDESSVALRVGSVYLLFLQLPITFLCRRDS